MNAIGVMSAPMRALIWGTLVVSSLMVATALGLWFERKFAARMQSRLGPTFVGPAGLLQPIADVLKMLQKEDIVPHAADKVLFELAPPLTVGFALAVAAVIPFSPRVVAADLDIGVLYVLAMGGLIVIPVFMGGWASNNKFALIGGMRAVAQAVSYEVPLVLVAMVPVILSGTLSVSGIVQWQADHHWFAVWPVIPGLPALVIFYMAMLAESNRIPFDIPEAESELVAGITTEYTGMKFGLFYMAEYVHTLIGSAVASALFLGGWDGPIAPGLHWMVLKTLVVFASVYWVRWTFLRLRGDQLMSLCWKVLVPISLGLVVSAAAWVVFAQAPG